MKAVIFDGELKFREDYPNPLPGEGEALVRVLLSGICNTDLELMRGYRSFRGVLGHEFVGVVETVRGGTEDLTGKRVVGEINFGCGRCGYCRKGMKEHCPERAVLGIAGRDGAMAEYVTLPAENLHEVPESLSEEEAVFAEPLAAAFEVIGQVHLRPTDSVLVMGDGKLGLLIALLLRLSHVDLTLLGRHESKLRIARDEGIRTVRPDGLEGTGGYDVVVEATGSPQGFEAALALVRPRGTVILKSTVAENTPLDLAPVVVNEIHVVGSRCGPFAPALRALAGGFIDVSPLVTAVYPFGKAGEAFRKAAERDSLKVMLDFR